MGTLKLSDFWLSPVPAKTRAGHMMEERLFTQQLTMGTFKLSDFWLSPVPTKTTFIGTGFNQKSDKDQGKTDDGVTPVFIAAQNGHFEVVRFLVESGANKDQGRIDAGGTSLYSAAYNGHLEVVRFLVESGASKDHGRTYDSYVLPWSLLDGATPLYTAAQTGHLEVVRFLVESGANKDQGTTDDATPVSIAAPNGHLEVVRFLVKSGTNKDQGRTNNGATPLCAASENGHFVGFLIAIVSVVWFLLFNTVSCWVGQETWRWNSPHLLLNCTVLMLAQFGKSWYTHAEKRPNVLWNFHLFPISWMVNNKNPKQPLQS